MVHVVEPTPEPAAADASGRAPAHDRSMTVVEYAMAATAIAAAVILALLR
jgi:hypothetical protein